jgi:hypothetical protein
LWNLKELLQKDGVEQYSAKTKKVRGMGGCKEVR